MAYASKILSEAERGFTPCEKEIFALVWAFQHREYLVGLFPVLLKTTHSLVKYVVTGKINNGHVFSSRLAKWALALLNKNVDMEKIAVLFPVPYGLMIEGEKHECPVLESLTQEPLLFEGGAVLSEMQERADVIRLVDGSCYYEKGKPYRGYAM